MGSGTGSATPNDPTALDAGLVLVNARVLTLDSADRIAASVAIVRGRILAVGSNEETVAVAGTDARIVDLGGATVTPGLIDTHVHPATAGRRMTAQVDLSQARSIRDIVDLVRADIARRAPGEWITGDGWLETALREGRTLRRSDLDRASPDNPVILTHATGHLACANSRALALGGITEASADPPEGSIERDADGRTPTGILHEFSAMQLVERHVPAMSADMWMSALQYGSDALAREGVTASKETYRLHEYLPIFGAYEQMSRDGTLRHRPVILCTPEAILDIDDLEMTGRRPSAGIEPDTRPLPRAGGVKLFLDGSLVARTAWMREPYPSAPGGSEGGRGYPAMSQEAFTSMAQAADRRGLHVAVHAIGDQAIDAALDAFETMVGRRRPALVHALVPTEDARARMRDLSISLETQPAFIHVLGAGYARALDSDRLRRLLPLRAMIDTGVAVSFGSDWPTCAPSPRLGMWAACTRTSPSLAPGTGVHEPEQRITVRDALRAYTTAAARAIDMQDEIGSIEPGKFGDMVIWDRDILATSPDDLLSSSIRQTIVAGNVVFDAADGVAPSIR